MDSSLEDKVITYGTSKITSLEVSFFKKNKVLNFLFYKPDTRVK